MNVLFFAYAFFYFPFMERGKINKRRMLLFCAVYAASMQWI